MSGVHIALAKAKKRVTELEKEVTSYVLRCHFLEEELSTLKEEFSTLVEAALRRAAIWDGWPDEEE